MIHQNTRRLLYVGPVIPQLWLFSPSRTLCLNQEKEQENQRQASWQLRKGECIRRLILLQNFCYKFLSVHRKVCALPFEERIWWILCLRKAAMAQFFAISSVNEGYSHSLDCTGKQGSRHYGSPQIFQTAQAVVLTLTARAAEATALLLPTPD